MSDYPKIHNGSKIAVIGGGPAGSFFSHFILKLASEADISIKVDIYDRKTFLTHLPRDCNMCAGVIGSNLYKNLTREGMHLGRDIIRHEVKGYAFHSKKNIVFLHQEPFSPIYTVFRGMTPKASGDGYISFDKYLLDNAMKLGANHIPELVDDIILPQKEGDKPVIKYRKGEVTEEVDLVVGAFGVNSKLSKEWDFGYVPPLTWHACQTEIEVEPGFIKEKLKNMIHIFTLGEENVKFVAFTPKGRFITVSAIGTHVKIKDLEAILSYPEIRAYLPEQWEIGCHCHPKIPVTAAKVPFYERLAMVGDACDSRYLKNGIESAFFTSLFAAETAINEGISKEALRTHYYSRCQKMFHFDNLCGKFLFRVNDFAASRPFFAEAQFSIANFEQRKLKPKVRFLSKTLWYLFTGEMPYKKILLKGLDPRLQATLLWQLTKTILNKVGKILFKHLPKNNQTSSDYDRHSFLTTSEEEEKNVLPIGSDNDTKPETVIGTGQIRSREKPLTLENGSTIAVIGGGPSGTCCAIKLLINAKNENKDIRVVIFEGKNFEFQYNQCMGILSPQVEEVLLDELEIALPEELIKRRIKNYVLCSDNEEISLDHKLRDKRSYTVRRAEFDRFLLNKAKEIGAEVISSRATGVEFVRTSKNDEVRVYNESGYFRADAVVGAFGLDEAMLNQFEYATKGEHAYQRPKGYLKTFITKIHADPEFISRKFNDSIFAFLFSSLPMVEFGAISPKGDHIIINIAGKKITSLDMDLFLNQSRVSSLLPMYDREKLEYYAGRFPTSAARNPYGHRYVIVGDATGWMKPFKGQGINIAMVTGIRGAQVIAEYGVSRDAFSEYAYKCRDMTEDYYHGYFIRILCNFITNHHLIDTIMRRSRNNKKLYDIMYNSVSGDKSYKEIMSNLLDFRLCIDITTGLGKDIISRIR